MSKGDYRINGYHRINRNYWNYWKQQHYQFYWLYRYHW
jgi:hypothetical protein